MKPKARRAIKPDAQPFDEIRIITVPRYKESELSGDEWRISATATFFRKGREVFQKSYSNLEYAVRLLDHDFIDQGSGGTGYYGGEGDFCDQEGCAATASVTYRLKKEFCRSGHGEELTDPVIRKFCDRHRVRGNAGLEDCDRNYEAV